MQNENNFNINKNLDEYKNKNSENFKKYELNQKENNNKIENLQKLLDDIFNNQSKTDKNINNFNNDIKKINNSLELLNKQFIEFSEKEKELVKNIELLKDKHKTENNNNILKLLDNKNNIKKQEELNKRNEAIKIENIKYTNSNENNRIYKKQKKKYFSENKLALNVIDNLKDNIIKAHQNNQIKDIINNLYDTKFISSEKIYYSMLEIDIKDFCEDLSEKSLKKYAYILTQLEKYLIKGTKVLDIGSKTGYL